MKRVLFFVPLVVFLVLAVYFAIGLTRDPRTLPSVLIDQPVPPLDLPAIEGRARGFTTDDLKGQVTLVNIFGSWCVACRVEHPFLMHLKANERVPVFGIDWREQNRSDGPAWLKRFGDPYTRIGDDPNSKAAIAFGVTGAPETFVVDHRGIIRYKHIGPLSEDIWRATIAPIVATLRRAQAEDEKKP
jgi:cytochrome c biogenesis protein CcmG/thiol:disulfide interchange protein DsbE